MSYFHSITLFLIFSLLALPGVVRENRIYFNKYLLMWFALCLKWRKMYSVCIFISVLVFLLYECMALDNSDYPWLCLRWNSLVTIFRQIQTLQIFLLSSKGFWGVGCQAGIFQIVSQLFQTTDSFSFVVLTRGTF